MERVSKLPRGARELSIVLEPEWTTSLEANWMVNHPLVTAGIYVSSDEYTALQRF